jgi:hypothetical protein
VRFPARGDAGSDSYSGSRSVSFGRTPGAETCQARADGCAISLLDPGLNGPAGANVTHFLRCDATSARRSEVVVHFPAVRTSTHACQVARCNGKVAFVHGVAAAMGDDEFLNYAQCERCGARYVRSVETGEVLRASRR